MKRENAVVFANTPNRTFYEIYIKRTLDICISMIGLLLLSPIILIASVVVFLEDPGNVVFTQKRVGVHKSYFNIHKLRSMRRDTPDIPTHLMSNPEQYLLKTGKVLRKYSIDELFQLIDIIRGKMSIVGPRPALWNQEDLIAERDKYGVNEMKPGLTGWAQINGRDQLSIEEKARFDGDYCTQLRRSSWSGFFIDCKCFWRTLKLVFKSKGVHEGEFHDDKSVVSKTPKDRVLIVTSVASMIDQFNMANIYTLLQLNYQVAVACNFEVGNTCSQDQIVQLREKLKNLGVKMYQVGFERNISHLLRNKDAYKQVLDLMKRDHYCFIHCQSPIGGVIGRLAASKTSTKVIYTVHGFHFFDGAPIANWIALYPIEKTLSYWTDILITINKEDYNRARQHFHAKEVVYVPGVGIDLNHFSNQPERKTLMEKRKRLNISSNAYVILSVGELNHNKNHISVIKAISRLEFRQDVVYVIAGQGPLRETLKKAAIKYGVSLMLLGYRNDVVNLYQMADLYIHPSIREGLSVALMEAIASRKVVLASDIRGNRDLLVDNCLFKVNDPINIARKIMSAYEKKLDDTVHLNWRTIQLCSLNLVTKDMEQIYGSWKE